MVSHTERRALGDSHMTRLVELAVLGLINQDARVYAFFDGDKAVGIEVVFEPPAEGQSLAYDCGVKWEPSLEELLSLPGEPEYWH